MRPDYFLRTGFKFEIFSFFEWILRLQRSLKMFLEYKSIGLRYLEGAPKSGLSNAATPKAIHRKIVSLQVCICGSCEMSK